MASQSTDREIDYARWRESVDWYELLLPAMEVDERNLQRRFLFADPNDIAEVAAIQAQLKYIDNFKNQPEYWLRQKAEAERKDQDARAREGRIRRAARQLVSYVNRR
jgi:hypothetical protein